MKLEMKSISSIKTNNAESPKTPGGISKSLLTPCRRVGLSRNWKKSGISPFISPLSSANSSTEVKQENEVRKRKKRSADEVETKNSSEYGENDSVLSNTPKTDNDGTPTRTLLPRKKSKTLLESKEPQEEINKEPQSISELNIKDEPVCNEVNLQQQANKHITKVSKLSRKNSDSKLKILKLPVDIKVEIEPSVSGPFAIHLESLNTEAPNKTDKLVSVKEKSPNNLTKECVVVIQKKIFKTGNSNKDTCRNLTKENLSPKKSTSQTLFDSDTDEIPLSNLSKKNNKVKEINDIITEETIHSPKDGHHTTNTKVSDDFVEKKAPVVKKLENKTTSTSGLKIKTKEKSKNIKQQIKIVPQQSSQSSDSFEEEDDDDFLCNKKRTILVKKTYNKVTKPLKAKSTGSITPKDIDDIKARIESKKNMLLAKAMSNETVGLRDLIKKWQTGCQTALTELLELMKSKMPEQNMEYSELLRLLKIPPDLVGYDSDNDCFNTPDDTNIILSALKID